MRGIGVVRSPFRELNGTPRQALLADEVPGEVRLFGWVQGRRALAGLEQVSHVGVVGVFHGNTNTAYHPVVAPPLLDGARTGVFGCRSPHRPNALALSLCRVVAVDAAAGVVRVRGMDLVDGTPVVGISGPPAGASFTLNFYLRPLMMKFLGRSPEPERIPVRLAAPFPAKGGSGGKAGAPAKVAGEVRPSIVAPGASFFGIKFLTVEALPDGTLSGTPLPGRPGSPEAESANAYYMMPSGPGVEPPAVGDVVWVELR